MDMEQFDIFTRQLSGAGSSRRQALRALRGMLLAGALTGVAARLGLADVAEANNKKHKAKSKQKRKPQAERKAQGKLQAEGKGKKKRHRKPKASPQCDPDVVKLCNRCEEPVCAAGDWVCRSNGEKECPDGSCVAANACCGGLYRCDDGTCIDPFSECCPYQKLCASNCIAKDACCHLDPTPLCGPCDEVFCEQGSWACRPRSDLKQCPDGSCVALGDCCSPEQPCGQCEHLVCENGEPVCRPTIGECDPGGEWDPELCHCRYCHEVCDEQTGLCQSIGCPEGSHCEAGQCIHMCTNPIRPQLCCSKETTAANRCVCRFANEICYGCPTGGMCACVPGQTCCDPTSVLLGSCPQACLAAEICQP